MNRAAAAAGKANSQATLGQSSSSWLSARRVRTHALLLAVVLWTVYAVDMSTPGLLDRFGTIKGADFLHFYTLGKLALANRGDLLYDMRAQAFELANFVPQARGYTYVSLYGPQVSLFFAPFAVFSYQWALVAWLALNILICAFCCFAVWKTCPNLRNEGKTVVVAALAFPGFFNLVLWGQTSGLALLCFTLMYLALRARRPFLAGLAFGLLIFKPQLALAVAIIFLCAGEWKILSGSVVAAAGEIGTAWWHYGTGVMRNYLHAITHVGEVFPFLEPRLYQTHSLRSFWTLLLPWSTLSWGLYLASAIVVLVLALLCWRSRVPLPLRYCALLLATVLVAPHLTVYDLTILAPAFLLLVDWALSSQNRSFSGALELLIYLCYPFFLLGPATRFTHVQFSVVAMTAMWWIIWRASLGDGTKRAVSAAI